MSSIKVSVGRDRPARVELNGADISHMVVGVVLHADARRPRSEGGRRIRPEVTLTLTAREIEVDLQDVDAADIDMRQATDG